MQLNPQEKSQVWWSGTLKGAAKGLVLGLAIGAVTAIGLSMACTLFPVALTPVFGGFITMSGGFSTIPLAIFSGLSGLVGGMLNSGNAAVAAYHQDKHNKLQMVQEEKLAQLESREQVLEQKLTPPSQTVQALIAKGPATKLSFADAEATRVNAPSTPTIQ